MQYLNKTEKDTAQISNISEDEWLNYYTILWTNSQELERREVRNDFVQVDTITWSEMNNITTLMKNKEAPGYDGLHLELFKYASHNVKLDC
jgi:hypothetical protein